MGNDNTRGQMLLALDDISASPGDELVGHIYIQLSKSIKKSAALYLQFSGSEFVK